VAETTREIRETVTRVAVDEKPRNIITRHDGDPRRHGVIEVTYDSGAHAVYRLTVVGELWSSVEWSPSRKRWCIEDGVGQCLAHVEHIHGEDVDAQRAIRLAKAMIRDGRMPTPEEAREALRRKEETHP
jgi:hypothetical protein